MFILQANSEIKTLILKHNRFEDYGADCFSRIMDENVTLQTLDLSWQRFQSKACACIAEGIKVNMIVQQNISLIFCHLFL